MKIQILSKYGKNKWFVFREYDNEKQAAECITDLIYGTMGTNTYKVKIIDKNDD